MTKWSSKTPDRNAIRVRNNQRRHRARVKAHAAELEAKLAAAQSQLEVAICRIKQLTSELEQVRQLVLEKEPHVEQHERLETDAGRPCCGDRIGDAARRRPGQLSVQPTAGPPHSAAAETPVSPRLTPPPPFSSQSAASGISASPAPLSIDVPLSTTAPAATWDYDRQDPDGNALPLPAAGESTITCKVALRIIDQQNYYGLVDAKDVETRLRPGFRRCSRPGGGCRVETTLLYALIDNITPMAPP